MERTKRRYTSRNSTAPRMASDGRVIEHRFGREDHDIIRAMTRIRYWSGSYMAALLGRSAPHTTNRFRALRSDELGLVKLCDEQQRSLKARLAGLLYYELTDEGFRKAEKLGHIVIPWQKDKSFTHSLLVSQIMASFEIGARELGLTHKYIPESREWYVTKDESLFADVSPFAVLNAEGKGRYIAAIEADAGTMPVFTTDTRRSSIQRKLRAYRKLYEQGEIQSTLNVTNAYTCIVTDSQPRAETIKKCIREEFEGSPYISSILVKTHYVFGDDGICKPMPTGHMLTEPWQRATGEPLVLGK